MGLATFSAILDHGLKLEKAGLDFFAASLDACPPDRRDALTRLKTEAEKNHKQLQVILRENVTEMVMEPFEALDEAAYPLDPGPVPAGGGAAVVEAGLRVVARQRDFLRHAARVVNLKEVKRAFEKMAARKEQLIAELGGQAG